MTDLVRTYYALPFSLSNGEEWIIWYSAEDADGVVLDGRGAVATWADRGLLATWAVERGLILDEEDSALYDLALLERWVAAPTSEIDCAAFLNAWNLFTDVAHAVTGRKRAFEADLGPGVNRVYDKLFFGNNLPAITPVGEHYEPSWTDEDLTLLRAVMTGGLRFFRTNLAR